MSADRRRSSSTAARRTSQQRSRRSGPCAMTLGKRGPAAKEPPCVLTLTWSTGSAGSNSRTSWTRSRRNRAKPFSQANISLVQTLGRAGRGPDCPTRVADDARTTSSPASRQPAATLTFADLTHEEIDALRHSPEHAPTGQAERSVTDDRWAGLPDLLSRLEDLELHLLSWGVVDGHLSRRDVDTRDRRAVERRREARPFAGRAVAGGVPGALGRVRPAPRDPGNRSLPDQARRDPPTPPDAAAVAATWRRVETRVVAALQHAGLRLPSPRLTPAVSRAANPSRRRDRGLEHGRMVWTSMPRSSARWSARTCLRSSRWTRLGASSTLWPDPQPAATIVTAGTGSGKTRAFYLPALIDIAATVGEKRTGPHTLALYPRNELLRDQAREAVRVIESIGPLAGTGTRPGGSPCSTATPRTTRTLRALGMSSTGGASPMDGRPRTSRAWTTTV